MNQRSQNMTSEINKSTQNDTVAELALMRMSIKAMRDYVNENIDAMLDRINRLIPPEDTLRYTKYKNYTKDDWHNFLEF